MVDLIREGGDLGLEEPAASEVSDAILRLSFLGLSLGLGSTGELGNHRQTLRGPETIRVTDPVLRLAV